MAETITLDPLSESALNTPFELEDQANGVRVKEVDWDDPDDEVQYAGTADTEGERRVSSRPNNRQPSMVIKIEKATPALLDQACAQLQQKIAKIAREGGTLKRVTNAGNAGTLDLLYARIAIPDDWLYVNAKTALIPVKFTALPYVRGPEVTTILDDFSTDSITAGKYTFDAGGGTIAVASAQLVPSSTAEKRFYRSVEGLTYCDDQATIKVTTGASVASGLTQLVETRIDANNYLRAGVNFAGAASTLTIEKVVAGAATQLGPASGAFTTLAATSYWIRFRSEKNLLTVELWTAPPTPTGTAAQSLTYTLAGADATQFGVSIAGQSGLRLIPQATDYRWDDLEIVPNLYVEKTNPVLVTPPIYGIKGDVPALGRLIVNDLSSQDQWWAIWGNESRSYSAGVAAVLDQFGSDTIGSGAWAFDAGAATLSVAGGLLVPSSTAEKRLYRTDAGVSPTDVRQVVKITAGASVASGATGLIARRIDATNFLAAHLNFAGAASTVSILKRVAGVDTTPVTSAAFTTAAATSYWLEFILQGSRLTVNAYAADPATGAAIIANATGTYTLTAAEAAQFAAGASGLRLIPQATDYRWDDFRAQPLAGGTPLLIDSEDLLVSGYSGVYSTRAGAFSGGTVATSVVRHTLANGYAASCALAPQGHVGSYRVFARIFRPTTNTGQVSAAFEWGTGDMLKVTRNDETTFAVDEREGDFTIADLGRVEIPPALKGTQQWKGQAIAKSTATGDVLDIDYLFLVPYAEGSGEASAVLQFVAPTAFTGRDEFDQVVGALTGKTAPIGGVWAGAGPATDFAVEVAGHTAERTAVSDTPTPRFAVSGAAAMTSTAVQVDFKSSVVPMGHGVVARYVDVNNLFCVRTSTTAVVGSAGWNVNIIKTIAGVETIVATTTWNPPVSTFYTMRLVVDANGRWWLWIWPTSSTPSNKPVAFGQDAVLATGGTLASGKPGFLDYRTSAVAATRNYDNFSAWVPVPDAAIFAAKQLEFRHDSTLRQDVNGAGPWSVSDAPGDYVKLLPAGRENRASRIVVDSSRNDPATMTDPSIGKLQVQLAYTPRYLSVAAL